MLNLINKQHPMFEECSSKTFFCKNSLLKLNLYAFKSEKYALPTLGHR